MQQSIEKAPAPSVERFFSPSAAAARPFLYSDAIEATRYERAELERAAPFGWRLRLRRTLGYGLPDRPGLVVRPCFRTTAAGVIFFRRQRRIGDSHSPAADLAHHEVAVALKLAPGTLTRRCWLRRWKGQQVIVRAEKPADAAE